MMKEKCCFDFEIIHHACMTSWYKQMYHIRILWYICCGSKFRRFLTGGLNRFFFHIKFLVNISTTRGFVNLVGYTKYFFDKKFFLFFKFNFSGENVELILKISNFLYSICLVYCFFFFLVKTYRQNLGTFQLDRIERN